MSKFVGKLTLKHKLVAPNLSDVCENRETFHSHAL